MSIERRRDVAAYSLDVNLDSTVSENTVDGSTVYTLTGDGDSDVTILYLHGGAYINPTFNAKTHHRLMRGGAECWHALRARRCVSVFRG